MELWTQMWPGPEEKAGNRPQRWGQRRFPRGGAICPWVVKVELKLTEGKKMAKDTVCDCVSSLS